MRASDSVAFVYQDWAYVGRYASLSELLLNPQAKAISWRACSTSAD